MALLALVVAALVVTGFQAEAPSATFSHPQFEAGRACDSPGCHAGLHVHKAPYVGACGTCHGLTSWRIVTYTHRDPEFNSGMAIHGVIGCVRCHTEGSALPSSACESCHPAQHDGWQRCSACHTPTGWRFPKAAPAGHLSLSGGHATVPCLTCHDRAEGFDPPRTCVDCHGSHHGGLVDCARCHAPASGWNPVGFEHDPAALTGRHASLACEQCHPSGRFAHTSTACVSCHGAHHGGLTACARCHTTAGFLPSTFDHATVFRLAGPHESLACTQCHSGSRYAHARGTTCVGCHGPQHGGLVTCSPCHTSDGSVRRPFDHSAFMPLTGGPHAALACLRCHPGDDFIAQRGATCTTCHGLGHGRQTVCTPCHAANGAVHYPFDHSAFMPLTGGPHAALACLRCHPSGVRADQRGATCLGCHGPQHGGLTACRSCHVANGAVVVPFAHPATFPLAGGPHASLACTQCHPGDVFSAQRGATCTTCHGLGHGRQTVCTPCHAANGAVHYPFDHTAFMPLAGGPHAALACATCHPTGAYADRRGATCLTCHGPQHGGQTVCLSCHSASGAVDHSAFFVLEGAHTSLPCSACHGAVFNAAAGVNCVDCHGVHHGNQTLCGTCHTTTSFVPTKQITHPAPIVLGTQHAARPCALCHPTLQFDQAPRPCSDCHTTPHVGPSDCVRCHMPTAWTDVHFTHPSIFPHSLEEFPCDDCHVGHDFTRPQAQICITCHW